MVLVLTGGEQHEQPVLPALMERGAVKRPGRGRPRIRPDRVAGDKGHSSPGVRRYLKGRGIGVVIPTKTDEVPDPSFDRTLHFVDSTVVRGHQHAAGAKGGTRTSRRSCAGAAG